MNELINGFTMAYDDNGAGPAVLLIHGFPLNRRMWLPQAEALAAAGYRVITPDLRGFGESDVPDSGYSMELFADDMIALLDHLGIERAIVGGMSMGGYVLLNMLERYRQRIAAACFIVTRSGADDEAGKAKRLAMARDVATFGSQVVADIFAKLLFADETMKNRPELPAQVAGWMRATDPLGVAGGLLAMADRKDSTPLLGNLRLPALVIGAEEDRAIPLENVGIFTAALPQSTSCVIPGAGHMVNMEQPEAFNACLLEFLKGITLISIE